MDLSNEEKDLIKYCIEIGFSKGLLTGGQKDIANNLLSKIKKINLDDFELVQPPSK